jgi:hypothetical protein
MASEKEIGVDIAELLAAAALIICGCSRGCGCDDDPF